MKDYSYIGLLGITGGIVKIFQFINHCSGTILLACTRRALVKRSKINKENNKIRHTIEYIEEPGIELTKIDDQKGSVAINIVETPSPNTPTRRIISK